MINDQQLDNSSLHQSKRLVVFLIVFFPKPSTFFIYMEPNHIRLSQVTVNDTSLLTVTVIVITKIPETLRSCWFLQENLYLYFEAMFEVWHCATQCHHKTFLKKRSPICRFVTLTVAFRQSVQHHFISVQKSTKKFQSHGASLLYKPKPHTTNPFGVQLKQANFTENHVHVCRESGTNLFKWSYNGFLHTVYIQDSNNITTQKMSLCRFEMCLYNK